MASASWGLVMTANEPQALVMANLGWHLGTGAAEIHVYFDDPDDPAAALADTLPRVRAIRCDAAHWAEVAPAAKRPPSHRRRQVLNANHALARSAADWLIHLDADEFLLQSRPLGEELHVARDLDCEVFFPVAERCFRRDAPVSSILDGVFRLSTKGLNRRGDGVNADAVIFGDDLPYLVDGLLGHSAGKCAVPRDAGYRIGIHWAYLGGGKQRAERYASTAARLLHFDGLTALHWLAKLVRYADYDPRTLGIAEHRHAQIEAFQRAQGEPGGPAALHRDLKELPPERLARLRAFGLLDETPFDPLPACRAVLAVMPDLSPARFDAELLRRAPHLRALVV